ncbi:MAG: Rne/Rng family ribonuclease [Candidatus Polarisedimenticolia bacterium]
MQRTILVDGRTPEIRIAVLEDERLVELMVERPEGRGLAGNIYKGRVNTILPGMQSAFVDVGLERDAFLYVEDVAPPRTAAAAAPDPAAGGAGTVPVPAPPGDRPRIEDLLRVGQEILVQLARDPLPHKGARITTHISLPGRYLVYLPAMSHVGVSHRVSDPGERERLRSGVAELARTLGLEGGLIVRTAAEGKDVEEFRADAAALAGGWEAIRRGAAGRVAPALLHEEPGAIVRVLRDLFREDVQQVVIDSETIHAEAAAYVGRTQPGLLSRLGRWEGDAPVFAARGLEGQIDKALRPRVWLKSGGSIVIQPTEALVAIDVNTGKYVGTSQPEETILRTNLEAAVEIVRQIRLRDLGGILVIDFIDMQEEGSRTRVVEVLEQELRKDRARSRVLGISEFGLVQITRQRGRPGAERVLTDACPRCHGYGRILSPETVAFRALRALGSLPAGADGGTVVLRVPADVAALLGRDPGGVVAAAGARKVVVQADPGLAPDAFSLTVP